MSDDIIVRSILSPATTVAQADAILAALGIDAVRITRTDGVVHCSGGGQITSGPDLLTALGALVDIHRGTPVLRAMSALCAEVGAIRGSDVRVRKVMFAGERVLVTVETDTGRRSTFCYVADDHEIIVRHLATI